MGKLNILLLVLVMVSAFAVVFKQNQSRLHFIELDKAQKREIQLEQDYALEIGASKIGQPQTD